MTRYTAYPRLAPFNRDSEFIARKPLKANGVTYKVGDLIDKTPFTTRRLRQLYEARCLEQGPTPLMGPEVPKEIDFAQLPTAAIVEWLAQRKKLPRPNSDRTKIINLARVVQQKEKEASDGVVPGKSTKEFDRGGVQGEAPERKPEKADA